MSVNPSRPRYKVEHYETRGVWASIHRGTLKTFSVVFAKKASFCRIMVDYSGKDLWEEVNTFPSNIEKWEAEKRAMLEAAIAKAVQS